MVSTADAVPETGGSITKVVEVTVGGLRGSLNVAVSMEDVAIFVAPLAGMVAVTIRELFPLEPVGVVSGAGPLQARRIVPSRIHNPVRERWGGRSAQFMCVTD